MEVFVVYEGDYDGGNVVGVFSTLKDADEFVAERKAGKFNEFWSISQCAVNEPQTMKTVRHEKL